MKKFMIVLCCVMYSCVSSLVASTFSIGVPQAFLDQNSALMVYMIDQAGLQYVGKCQLDSNSKDRKILQNELEMTTLQEADRCDAVADLMNQQETSDQNLVILHFEFDHVVKILRILVVKNSFLEENPFDVLTLPLPEQKQLEKNHHTFQEFDDELDALSALVDNVDVQAMEESMQRHDKRTSRLKQCMLYAEIYMLMQYGRVKRAMFDMASWLYN